MIKKVKNLISQTIVLAAIGGVVWTTILNDEAKEKLSQTAKTTLDAAKGMVERAEVLLGIDPHANEGETARARAEAEWEKVGL